MEGVGPPAAKGTAQAAAAEPPHRPAGPSAFRRAVEAEKHVFDFASFIFRITAWWSAFALLLHAALTTRINVVTERELPFTLDIDISIPAMILTAIGLTVFAGYGLYMIGRVWVILARVRDAHFPRERHGRALRLVLTFLVFCAVNIAVLLAVVLVFNTLQKL